MAVARLRQFGYAFNKEGQLRKLDKKTNEAGDEPFQFDVYGNDDKNQDHYEQVAEIIPEIVYDLLEKNGLKRVYLPGNLPKDESTFIFTQPEYLHKSKKLLVLIHGSGYVRAGQWARSLIINNSLEHGTQLPYIQQAQKLGYHILVMNTNDNFRIVNGQRRTIQKLGTPSQHAQYVWKNALMPGDPESVAIVAHSFGGSITMELAEEFTQFFEEKVFGIALTDSTYYTLPKKASTVLKDITCNWVANEKPLDTVIKSNKTEIRKVSAGHEKHEWTSWAAKDAIFKFLEEKYDEFIETHN